MKSVSLLFLLFFSLFVNAQVGVGTTNPNATLDVTAANPSGTSTGVDGMLIPRVTRERARSMTSVPTSTLIYVVAPLNGPADSTVVNVTTTGFYFFNGTVWEKLSSGATNAWDITGNSGLSGTTNFLGTTDNVDVAFRRNNLAAGKIGATNTSFGLGALPANTGNRNTSVGFSALNLNTGGNENTAIGNYALGRNTGSGNTAIGHEAEFGSGVAFNNTTAIGFHALFNNSANDNTAVGYNALQGNGNSAGNTSVGAFSLNDNTGANNTALGFGAGREHGSGANNTYIGFEAGRNNIGEANNNVFLGYQAGYGSTGSGNVAMGYSAGSAETGSNKLYIENSNADANNALIYGEFDTNIVRVNGTLQISNPTTANGYALPVSRGISGQVLHTNGSGGTSWSSLHTVMPFTTTGVTTGVYNVSSNEYTVRVYNSVSEVRLPSAAANPGKVYIIIGSNTIAQKTFSSAGGAIYDDVTNTTITVLNPNERYMVQSDGTGWLVIGR